MSESNEVQDARERRETFMRLQELQPNTVSTFGRCARAFLAQVAKPPREIVAHDVEEFLLRLSRQKRSPVTLNVTLAAIRLLLHACLG